MEMQQPQNISTGHQIKNFFAHIISIVLIPIFAPIYLFSIILFYFPFLTPITDFSQKIMAIFLIFLATTLPPFILVFILYKMKKISSLHLNDKNDRLIPQIFSCFNYLLITTLLVYKLGVVNPLTRAMVAVTISLITISIITPFWKISVHSSGATGILAIASILYSNHPAPDFLLPYIIMLFLTFAVCIARLQLKVHTASQVVAGCILGSIIGLLCFAFYK